METPLNKLVTNIQHRSQHPGLFHRDLQSEDKDIYASAYDQELKILVREEYKRTDTKSGSGFGVLLFLDLESKELLGGGVYLSIYL